ncbi:MAG: CDP-glycerol glycerophosphotransferase family protein [Marinifilaceae bacterium]|jgi:CDP-glycerol glycerophosphotransferase (TagB/SpsB family)|nr:CDP-glycerol glycerophosphotransferase family protein [Marinifilaceae bacterium]
MNDNYFVVFYAHYLYYLPQYLPVARELKKRNLSYLFVIDQGKKRDVFEQEDFIRDFCSNNHVDFLFYNEAQEKKIKCDYIVCGGGSPENINLDYKKSALLVHGIGTKVGCFDEQQNRYDLRFIEGEFREQKLKELYPNANNIVVNAGFAKLDTAYNMTDDEKLSFLNYLNLDTSKKTLLYAPTFYPSSIEKMGKNFPHEFSEYNIIIKPHFFSFLREKYAKQRNLLEHWSKAENVYVADFTQLDLSPFMAIADLMISDESSAMFEFISLNKPLIVNRFLKLRLSYRLWGQRKYNKRIDQEIAKFKDVGVNIYKYSHLKETVDAEIANPENMEAKRIECTRMIVGPTDGRVSERIVNAFVENI